MADSDLVSHRTAIVSLLVLTVLAYANSFYGTFQFDDLSAILEDPRLENPSVFLSHLGQMVRPFLKLTFMVDRQVYGDIPTGYHLLNFLLHLGSALLIYGILFDSLRLYRKKGNGAADAGFFGVPFWTALLFLIHPIGTEAVTYISGRPTGLMAFFYLVAFYLYLRSTGTEEGRAKFFPWYPAALLSFGLSLLSKEAAITLPVALFVFDAVIRRQKGGDLLRSFFRLHLPFWAILFLFLLFGAFHPRYSFLFRYSFEVRPLYENFLTQVNTIVYALSLFFLPGRQNFDHDLPVFTSILQGPVFFFSHFLGCSYGRGLPLSSPGAFFFFRRSVVLPPPDPHEFAPSPV